jgi:hypothetical protein
VGPDGRSRCSSGLNLNCGWLRSGFWAGAGSGSGLKSSDKETEKQMYPSPHLPRTEATCSDSPPVPLHVTRAERKTASWNRPPRRPPRRLARPIRASDKRLRQPLQAQFLVGLLGALEPVRKRLPGPPNDLMACTPTCIRRNKPGSVRGVRMPSNSLSRLSPRYSNGSRPTSLNVSRACTTASPRCSAIPPLRTFATSSSGSRPASETCSSMGRGGTYSGAGRREREYDHRDGTGRGCWR